MNPKPTIVLASSSASRQAQLKRLGLQFDVLAPDIDETPQRAENATQLVLRLSEQKAHKVMSAYPQALIIAGDQTAEFEGKFLTKPGGRDKAIEQLSRLQGHTVTFVSGLCITNAQNGRSLSSCVECVVKFRQLSATQIENYVDRDKPYYAAGSFKAESAGIALFEYMRSDDPSAITGMPLITLVSLLEAHGYNLFC